jgi:hypothetical protein
MTTTNANHEDWLVCAVKLVWDTMQGFSLHSFSAL